MSGVLFAFANFAMKALAQLSAQSGMEPMQRTTVTIVNALFVAVFLWTALLCATIVVLRLTGHSRTGSALLPLGGPAYLARPAGVTMVFNVPLNQRVATAKPAEAASAGPTYVPRWLR